MQAKVLQAAYGSSQQELGLLQQAALEVCQSINEGAGQAGSSVTSRLRALGGHVARRMRGALRLGIQKALSVVQSHYQVNLAALATGYIVADDLDDDGAQAVADHLDALAAPAADILADDFEEVLFSNTAPPGPSSSKSSWALWPLDCSQNSSRAAYVIRQFDLKTCKLSVIRFCFIVLSYPFPIA
jgi:hypothetical protein